MADQNGTYYTVETTNRDNTTVCYRANLSYNQGIWRMSDTLSTSLPMFVLQLTIMMLLSRFLHLFFHYFRFPLFVSEMAAGIIMGPSGPFSHKHMFMDNLIPFFGNRVLETIAHLGIVYYMFLVGLEMDATPILRTGRKAMILAIAGAVVPAITGAFLYPALFINGVMEEKDEQGRYFWVIVLAVTSFPDITRDLAQRKVLVTELGKTALSTAVISDLLSWILLVVAIAVCSDDQQYMAVVSTAGFVALLVFAGRPAMVWLIKESEKREEYNDYHMCFVLTGVAACSFVTEQCGTHSIVGAFVFGLVIPNCDLAKTLKGKLEDYVAATMLPLFYLISGFRFNTEYLYKGKKGIISGKTVAVVVFVACSVKVLTTFIVSILYKHSVKDSLALGLFLNTKGILALIVLNTGRNISALDNQTYTVMAIAILIMTAIPVPATFFLRTSRRSGIYLHRTIQTSSDGELRVLACIHSTRNVAPLINLLQSTEATKDSPICLYGVHLIELTGRASAMIIMHSNTKNKNKKSSHHHGHTHADSDHIITALEGYEASNNSTSVHPLTVVSPYNTMHDDICRVADEKFVALILLPFHKLPTADGALQEDNVHARDVNLNILRTAPCSVGILVDRGIRMLNRTDSDFSGDALRSYAVFFRGGADDREALAFAWKMSRNPKVSLTVVRFIPGKEAESFSKENIPDDEEEDEGIFTSMMDEEVQKQLDNEYMTEFRFKTVDDRSVQYTERMVDCGEDTIAAIRDVMDMDRECELFILGKGSGAQSPMTSGLAYWSDTPELGLVGDAVVQSNFATDVSVLVMQQYNPKMDGLSMKEDDSKGFDTSILND